MDIKILRSVFACALAAATFGAAPVAAQNSRYEVSDPNKSPEDAQEQPAQAAPAPAATRTRSAPRIFRVVRPGGTRVESNSESASSISGGGQSLSGSGISVGSKDVNSGAPVAKGGSVSGGGGGGDAKVLPPKPEIVNAKVTVSTSLAGPWLPDGEACRAPKVYTRLSGVDKKKPPKGCASPFASNDCMDISKHRDFLPSEWFNSSTIQTVINGADFPAGKYGLYLAYSKTDIKRVGTATLKNCAPAAGSVAGPVTCRWNCPSFVVGPCYGPNCSASPSSCTQSNQGQTGSGGGCMWTCQCKASAAPAPAPAPPAPVAPAPVKPPVSSACKWKASGATFGPCYGPSDSTCSTGNRGAQQPACGATYTCTCP